MNTESPDSEQRIDNKEIFKTLLDTRKFEINFFWQRSNYFLVLNTALAIGFFNHKPDIFSLVLALFGASASFLWFRVTLGSKYWQTWWEHSISMFERKVAPDGKFFDADQDTIKNKVAECLGKNRSKPKWEKWLDQQVVKKPSVSDHMMLLSLLFVAGWGIFVMITGVSLLWPRDQCMPPAPEKTSVGLLKNDRPRLVFPTVVQESTGSVAQTLLKVQCPLMDPEYTPELIPATTKIGTHEIESL